MGNCSKILLLIFLNILIIHGEVLCPASFCGSSLLSIRYPFKLEGPNILNGCTYFNLTCSRSVIFVTLPHPGESYVRAVDCIARYIQLYDPWNCLGKRLLNLSLESSTFTALDYENYTFYICPLNSQVLGSHAYSAGCFINSTVMVASRKLSRRVMEGYGCMAAVDHLVPQQLLHHDDNEGFLDDYLFLTWQFTACKDCDARRKLSAGRWRLEPLAKVIALSLSLPALIVMALTCCSVFCLHLLRLLEDKHLADAAEAVAMATTTAAPTSVGVGMPTAATINTGLDESRIAAYTEVITGNECGETIPSTDTNTCPVCLESYCQKEFIRVISKCGHRFHDNCIQQWLGKNSTCPVCRASLSNNVS